MTDKSLTTDEIGAAPSLPGLDPHSTARDEVRRMMQAEGKSGAAIAKQVDVAYATFSAWLNATYTGRNEPILEKVCAWLDSRKAAARTRSVMRRAPGFVQTPSADNIVLALEHAQHAPDIVVVSGPPGVGKTMACEAYTKQASSVWMITAEPVWSASPRMLMESLLEQTGVTEKLTRHQASRAIIKRVTNSGGLLLIDEAQNLSTKAMDQLRTIHDKSSIGVALVGNETVHSRLQGHAREVEFAQLFSRVGLRTKVSRAQKADIDLLLDAWAVQAEPERKLLREIARKPGALRGMTKTLRMAFMRAGMDGREAVSSVDIASAWKRISDTEITADAA